MNTSIKNVLWVLIAALAGSVLTLGAYKLFDLDEQIVKVESATEQPYVLAANKYQAESGDMPLDFSHAAEKTTPAVVHIKSTSGLQDRREEEMPQDPFRYFFGPQNPHQRPQRPRQASGSGVIINGAEGYIVTNNHVIEGADAVEVILADKRNFEATVIGTDPSTDLALLQVDAEEQLPFLKLGSSEDAKVGQWVLAVGNPFNLTSTVTAGIVSAKGRNINILKDAAPIESFIQTDAAVNPGNSGGALVNLNGDLIGINTAIASPTGAYSGYAFAVPTTIVSKVVEDLVKYGAVQRGFLGVSIRNINPELSEGEGLEVNKGAYVAGLMEKGAAEDAGIEKGDVITKVNGKEVRNVAELQEAIARKRPGDEVKVTIIRDGEEKILDVELRNRAGTTAIVKKDEVQKIDPLGAEFRELKKGELKDWGLSHGVQIERLYAGKLRQYTRLEPGFVITHMDKEPVKSIQDIQRLLSQGRGGVMIEGRYPDSKQRIYDAIPLEE